MLHLGRPLLCIPLEESVRQHQSEQSPLQSGCPQRIDSSPRVDSHQRQTLREPLYQSSTPAPSSWPGRLLLRLLSAYFRLIGNGMAVTPPLLTHGVRDTCDALPNEQREELPFLTNARFFPCQSIADSAGKGDDSDSAAVICTDKTGTLIKIGVRPEWRFLKAEEFIKFAAIPATRFKSYTTLSAARSNSPLLAHDRLSRRLFQTEQLRTLVDCRNPSR